VRGEVLEEEQVHLEVGVDGDCLSEDWRAVQLRPLSAVFLSC